MNALKPTTVREACDAVRDAPCIQPHGGRTKPTLCQPSGDTVLLDMTGLAGMIEYEPSEYTFTARAGTPVRDIIALLDEHGQYLPCDPVFVEAGSTLGGTLASGLSGPGRLRYGGLRDFILGIEYIDAEGKTVRSGGKVVKNAAGFDLPKLFVGSLGRLGVITELSVKVFPKPQALRTFTLEAGSVERAVDTMLKAYRSPLEPDAIEIESAGRCVIRIAGTAKALPERQKRYDNLFGKSTRDMTPDQAHAYWADLNRFAWTNGAEGLVKTAVAPRQVAALNDDLAGVGIVRHYSGCANTAYLALRDHDQRAALVHILQQHGLSGLVLRGGSPALYLHRSSEMLERIKCALDPRARYPEFDHRAA